MGLIPGCLLCNTATELGASDPEIARRVEDYFQRLEQAFISCLTRAKKLDEIQGSPAELRARALMTRSSIQGILVALRLSKNERQARRTLAAVESYCLD